MSLHDVQSESDDYTRETSFDEMQSAQPPPQQDHDKPDEDKQSTDSSKGDKSNKTHPGAIPKRPKVPSPNEKSSKGVNRVFKKKDRVKVKDLTGDEMKKLQEGHGGCNELMSMVIFTAPEYSTVL